MIEFVFHKVSRLLTEYAHILNDESEKKLLNKIKSDLSSYQFINFYAVRVDLQCDNKLKMIDDYLQDIGLLERKLRRTPSPGHEITFLINELKATLISLAEKKAKILRLKAKIPEGILDTKRALFVANADALSYSTQEDTKLKTQLDALKEFMKGANRAYNVLIRQGGTLSVILYGITALYWIKLHEFRVMLTQTIADVESSDLTPTGKLAQRSLVSALGRIPSIEQITPMLQLTTDSNERRSHISFKPQSSFYSIDGRKICSFLQQSNKLFFYMPHNESMCHIDYDPEWDIAGTGGNCFGESIMFIHELSRGAFKRLCPEFNLMNFQLDQNRKLAFGKKVIGQAETEVFLGSQYHSLQWSDIKHLFFENASFNAGDICTMLFSMNEYTRSQRQFTPAHVAAVAKLDTSQCRYKYVVYEKEIGIFGLPDDESLAYVVSQIIMPMYESMNYSKLDLIKYEEATPKTYLSLNKIPAVEKNPPRTRQLHSN